MDTEAEEVRQLRNAVAYDGVKNSIVEWMNSNSWNEIPSRMHIRGECVERWISSKGPTKITRFVVQGAVSGEIPWK